MHSAQYCRILCLSTASPYRRESLWSAVSPQGKLDLPARHWAPVTVNRWESKCCRISVQTAFILLNKRTQIIRTQKIILVILLCYIYTSVLLLTVFLYLIYDFNSTIVIQVKEKTINYSMWTVDTIHLSHIYSTDNPRKEWCVTIVWGPTNSVSTSFNWGKGHEYGNEIEVLKSIQYWLISNPKLESRNQFNIEPTRWMSASIEELQPFKKVVLLNSWSLKQEQRRHGCRHKQTTYVPVSCSVCITCSCSAVLYLLAKSGFSSARTIRITGSLAPDGFVDLERCWYHKKLWPPAVIQTSGPR